MSNVNKQQKNKKISIKKDTKGNIPPLLISIIGFMCLTLLGLAVWITLFIISAIVGPLFGKSVGDDFIPSDLITFISLLVSSFFGTFAIILSSYRGFKYSSKLAFAVLELINIISLFIVFFQVSSIIRFIRDL